MKKNVAKIWNKLSKNEKMMILLIICFIIGIILRWDTITDQTAQSLENLFGGQK